MLLATTRFLPIAPDAQCCEMQWHERNAVVQEVLRFAAVLVSI